MSEIKKFYDLFNPWIIVYMVILFLLIAMPMECCYDKLSHHTLNLYFYIFLGLLFFILGTYVSKYLLNRNCTYVEDKYSNSQILSIYDSYSKNELIFGSFVLFGIILQVINIVSLGGIPLFSASLKAHATGKIWFLSYVLFIPSINILITKYDRKSYYILLLIGLFLFILTGYRTTTMAIMISVLISIYYTRNVDLKYIILIILVIVFVLLIVGFIAIKAISWQHWSLNPIEIISYRAAFTLNILVTSIEKQFSTSGSLFYTTLTGFFTHTDARVLVGIITVNRNHSITSTIFGPALLDFGIVGMIVQMFLIGIILNSLYFIQSIRKGIYTAFYSILLAQTIIWIETGPTDIVVWFFYFISIILIIHYVRWC